MSEEASATERRAQKILQELLRAGKVSVLSLAKRLKVSPTTIRRDLGELEQRGLLRRSHGGAVPFSQCFMSPFVTFPIITSRSDSGCGETSHRSGRV